MKRAAHSYPTRIAKRTVPREVDLTNTIKDNLTLTIMDDVMRIILTKHNLLGNRNVVLTCKRWNALIQKIRNRVESLHFGYTQEASIPILSRINRVFPNLKKIMFVNPKDPQHGHLVKEVVFSKTYTEPMDTTPRLSVTFRCPMNVAVLSQLAKIENLGSLYIVFGICEQTSTSIWSLMQIQRHLDSFKTRESPLDIICYRNLSESKVDRICNGMVSPEWCKFNNIILEHLGSALSNAIEMNVIYGKEVDKTHREYVSSYFESFLEGMGSEVTKTLRLDMCGDTPRKDTIRPHYSPKAISKFSNLSSLVVLSPRSDLTSSFDLVLGLERLSDISLYMFCTSQGACRIKALCEKKLRLKKLEIYFCGGPVSGEKRGKVMAKVHEALELLTQSDLSVRYNTINSERRTRQEFLAKERDAEGKFIFEEQKVHTMAMRKF